MQIDEDAPANLGAPALHTIQARGRDQAPAPRGSKMCPPAAPSMCSDRAYATVDPEWSLNSCPPLPLAAKWLFGIGHGSGSSVGTGAVGDEQDAESVVVEVAESVGQASGLLDE
jgi:hypothetical protein